MKNIFKLLVACAFATLGFSACQQEEINYNEESATHTVTFIAESPETKTTVDISDKKTAKFAWTAQDEKRFTVYENDTEATSAPGSLSDGKMTVKATFAGSAVEVASYVAVVNKSNNEQIMSAEAYDEDADILVSKAVTAFDGESGVQLQFKREVAIAKMTLKGLDAGEVVNHITVSSTADIAGSYGVEGWNSKKTFLEIYSASSLGGNYDIVANEAGVAVVWFTCIPQDAATLTVKVDAADGDTYTKEFSKPITLTRGDVKAFGVAMTKDVVAAPEPVVLYCSDVTTGGYVTTATHVKNENLPFEYLQIMANGKNNPTGYGAGQVMQFRSSSGEIYNTESFGSPVKYVEVYAQSSNPFYVYYGDKKAPSENNISRPTTPSGTKTISIKDNNDNTNVEEEVNYYLLNLSSYNANYIRIVNGSSTNYFYKIVLLFDEPETVQVTGIKLDKTEVTINKGEKTTLTATITPSNATNKNVSWSSSTEGVATVDNGVVTAVAEGNATITVTTEDGSHTATCFVTVTAAPTGGATAKTYRHVFTAKPSTGNNVKLSEVSWNITATNLGNYNSQNYAGVQFGTSDKNGQITLKSPSAWSYTKDDVTVTKIKEVRLWLNLGGTSVTPSVTIGGKAANSDGTKVTKNSKAGSDWTKTTKVTFTPAAGSDTGVIVIDVTSVKAGYICAIEIDAE